MSLAHDAEMIGMLQKIVDEAEVDIARLEAEQAGGDAAQQVTRPNSFGFSRF